MDGLYDMHALSFHRELPQHESFAQSSLANSVLPFLRNNSLQDARGILDLESAAFITSNPTRSASMLRYVTSFALLIALTNCVSKKHDVESVNP